MELWYDDLTDGQEIIVTLVPFLFKIAVPMLMYFCEYPFYKEVALPWLDIAYYMFNDDYCTYDIDEWILFYERKGGTPPVYDIFARFGWSRHIINTF